MVKDGSKYKIIDAKSSINQNLSSQTSEDLIKRWSTKNQEDLYEALKNGEVESIKPRGSNAVDYFENINPAAQSLLTSRKI